MSPKLRSLFALGPVVLALVASDDADADLRPPPDMYSVHRTAPPPLVLPPEPPLPAGCVKPTAENCADSAWLGADACWKDSGKNAAMRALCNWTILKAWNDANATIDPTLFPKSAPNSVYPPALLTPAQRVEHGKRMTAQPSSRPGEKRRFPGWSPHGQIGTRVASPTTLAMTPKVARGGGGSYATLSTPHIVQSLGPVHRELGSFRGVPVKNINGNRVFTERANAVSALLLDRPPFVSTGDAVSSCEEYAYKRWGDYSRFSFAAKRLGRNYRQVFNIATDPRSHSFINKMTLNQIGTEPTPRQISEVFKYPVKPLPPNAFIAGGAGWLDSAVSTTDAKGKSLITDLQKATIKALVAAPHPLQAITDRTPLGIHREMKALFDSKYDPLDEELDDISKRASDYLALLRQRASLVVENICTGAGDPCHRCRPWESPPLTMPVGLQGLKDGVGGPAIIDPIDLKDRFRGGSKYGQLSALTQIQKVAGAVSNFRASGPGAGGGLKQKGPEVLGQMRRGGGAGPEIPPIKQPPQIQPPVGPSQNQCMTALASKHAQVSGAMTEIERQLTRLLVNELAFGDRSCLADPRGALGNLCDWSYQEFALTMSTLFDADVEADFKECRSHITADIAHVSPTPTAARAFTTVVKNAPNQYFLYPCTARRDFTTNAASVFTYIDWENDEHNGRWCEAKRVNAGIAQQQDAIRDAMTGVQWEPATGTLFDWAHDSQGLGDASTLGASFEYDSKWTMTKTGAPKGGDPLMSCRFVGAAHSNIDAKIQFFGTELNLLKLDGATESDPTTVSVTAQYLDIDTMSTKTLPGTIAGKRLAPGETYNVALADPPVNLGGIEYSFWFTIGPIPIHVVFGAVATAGVDYRLEGAVGDNCADPKLSSGFKLVAEAKPYARADAYADASVDVGVASAGVRLDLNLLNLSIPIGVHVTSSAEGYEFKNGGTVEIDMLSGHLSAYAHVGVSPFDATYNAEIFGWDGFHASAPVFGLDKKIPQGVVRIAMAGRATGASVSCMCTATECCSNATCEPGVGGACPGVKAIGSAKYYCTYNKTDYAEMTSRSTYGAPHTCFKYVH